MNLWMNTGKYILKVQFRSLSLILWHFSKTHNLEKGDWEIWRVYNSKVSEDLGS